MDILRRKSEFLVKHLVRSAETETFQAIYLTIEPAMPSKVTGKPAVRAKSCHPLATEPLDIPCSDGGTDLRSDN